MPGGNYCAVNGCGNNSQNRRDLSYYRLPTDRDRKQEWLLCMRRQDIVDKPLFNTYRVCSVHFKPDMFINQRLKKNAIPVLHLDKNVAIDIDESSSTEVKMEVKEELVEAELLPDTMTVNNSRTDIDIKDKDVSVVMIDSETNAIVIPESSSGNDIDEGKNVGKINYQEEFNQHVSHKFIKEVPRRTYSRTYSRACTKKFKEEGVQTTDVLIIDTQEEKDLRNELIENEKKLSELETAITDLQVLVKNQDENETAVSRKRKLEDNFDNDSENDDDLSFDLNNIRKKLCPSNFFGKFLRWQEVLHATYKGNRYDKELKLFAFTLFCTNPKLYGFLQKAFTLPSIRMLQRMKFSFNPSVNDELILLLSKRLSGKPPNYKYCIICLDEIYLKKNLWYNVLSDEIVGFKEIDGKKYHEIAGKAFVVYLKGCFGDYKQPLGYALTTDNQNYTDLSNWLDKTIKALFNAGFVVCAVLSDQRPFYIDFSKSKGVSEANPFFMIDDKKIFYIFDVTSLITSLRNYLLRVQQLSFDGNKLVSWQYIKMFYHNDQKRDIKRAPKLNDALFDNATHVLSYTVASAMSSEIELGNLPTQAQDTIDFILKIDRLHDVLNSTKEDENNVNKYKRPFCGAAYQINCLQNSLNMFRTISVESIKDKEIFYCLQITINAFLQLLKYGKYTFGVNCIHTRYFKNDDTDKMFVSLSNQLGKNVVTANKLKKIYSKLIIDNLFKKSDDSDADLESLFTTDGVAKPLFKSQIMFAFPVSLRVITSDYRIDLPMQNTFTCLCQHLLDKTIEYHICPTFKSYLQGNDNDQEQLLKEPAVAESMTNSPPEKFITIVEVLEQMFIDKFKVFALETGTGQKLIFEMGVALEDSRPCDCFPTSYLVKLYLRVRIHNVIKLFNDKIKSTRGLLPFQCIEHL